MTPRLVFASLVLLLALGAGAFLGGTHLSDKVQAPRPSLAPLPRLTPEVSARLFASRFRDQHGQMQTLEQWRGTPLLINFWASWCPPCRAEIPDLVALHQETAQNNGQIIGISVDLADKTQKIATDAGARYPLLLGGAEGLALLPLLGNSVNALPYTLVIDRNGEILLQHAGRVPLETLRRAWRTAQTSEQGKKLEREAGK